MMHKMKKEKKDEPGMKTKKKEKQMESYSFGVWALSSFINQDDCRPTAGWIRVGKYMVVRASRALKKKRASACDWGGAGGEGGEESGGTAEGKNGEDEREEMK